MYSLIKKLLFVLEPESAHAVVTKILDWTPDVFLPGIILKPVTCMGIRFPNSVGLAAGFDKNADHGHKLSQLGFGFIEFGTVTPRSQLGNSKPRLCRLVDDKSLWNRLGFNNKGVSYLVEKIRQIDSSIIKGINIGINKDTSLGNAVFDYIKCLRKSFHIADYIVMNISSPNTEGLRELQKKKYISDILERVKIQHERLIEEHKKHVPLLIKISPDLNNNELEELIHYILKYEIDGIIVTNTTTNISEEIRNKYSLPQGGGISGKLLQDSSNRMLSKVVSIVGNKIPIISVGGIDCIEEAQNRLRAGAALVQIYSEFVYSGVGNIRRMITAI